MRHLFWSIIASLLLLCPTAQAETPTERQLVEIGRQIYQQGLLSNGEPVKAIVLGNVEVTGTQFTCLNCHRRSGLGGPEGTKYVLPTNGTSLLSPRTDLYMSRPAYNEQSFAEAMSSGMNPNGEVFDPIMPRYELSGLQMSALFAYLKTLSSEFSPGLTDETLHVATIVSDQVPATERQAMLGVIEKFFANKNAETRHEKKRYDSGPFYQEYRNKAYRRWRLHLWELTGTPDSWQQQLEKHYQQQPVFAILSGLVHGSWEPIHRFSQQNRIPAILPNTNLPLVEKKTDFYTLYYSQGLYLEAQVLGEELLAEPAAKRILQVFRAEREGEKAANSLNNVIADSQIVESRFILSGQADEWEALAKAIGNTSPEQLVLWLKAEDLQAFSNTIKAPPPSYLSSSLLDGKVASIPEGLTESAQLLHVFNLPKDHRSRFLRVASWMRVNKLPLTNERIQGQTYYACMLLNAGMKHIKRYFYREFFLDLLDHGERMAAYSGNYPRLSFGPEQRFLAKGAYLINLKNGEANWVVPDH